MATLNTEAVSVGVSYRISDENYLARQLPYLQERAPVPVANVRCCSRSILISQLFKPVVSLCCDTVPIYQSGATP